MLQEGIKLAEKFLIKESGELGILKVCLGFNTDDLNLVKEGITYIEK